MSSFHYHDSDIHSKEETLFPLLFSSQFQSLNQSSLLKQFLFSNSGRDSDPTSLFSLSPKKSKRGQVSRAAVKSWGS